MYDGMVPHVVSQKLFRHRAFEAGRTTNIVLCSYNNSSLTYIILTNYLRSWDWLCTADKNNDFRSVPFPLYPFPHHMSVSSTNSFSRYELTLPIQGANPAPPPCSLRSHWTPNCFTSGLHTSTLLSILQRHPTQWLDLLDAHSNGHEMQSWVRLRVRMTLMFLKEL